MCVTNNSMLQFLSSPEMPFLNKIKAWMTMLEAPPWIRESPGEGCFALVMKIKFRRCASRLRKNKSFSRKLKRCCIWIRKKHNVCCLRGETGQKVKAGAPFHPPRLSELHDKQQEKSSFSCVREVRRLSESRPSAFLSARSSITSSRFTARDWGAPASTVLLWWRGVERWQRFHKASPSVWDGVEQTAHCVSHICQANRVQRRCHCVWEVSAGGVLGECWQWSGRSDWVTIPTEGGEL